jgi:hypothetical protein
MYASSELYSKLRYEKPKKEPLVFLNPFLALFAFTMYCSVQTIRKKEKKSKPPKTTNITRKKISESIVTNIKKAGGQGSFKREK